MAADPAPPSWRGRVRRKRLALAIWSGLATAAVLLLVDGVFAGRSLIRNVTAARSELNVGIEAIVTGDPEGARPHLAAAVEAADRAIGAVGHPSLGIAGLLPIAGENLDAAAGVAAASKETALAGVAMLDVSETLGWSDVGLPGASAAGDLDLEAMEAAAATMDGVVARLRAAQAALEASSGGGLLGPVAAGYDDAVESLGRRADLSARLRDTLRLLPSMFGGGTTHRYLVCVSSLGVPRPGGGAPAAVGVLVADASGLRIETFAGRPDELAPAPSPLLAAAASPHGPTAARQLLAAAAEAGAPGLEGVIRLDAIALQDLVWVAGDVRVEGRDLPLSDATTATALEVDAFLGGSQPKAAQLHASWASRVLSRFLRRRPGLESFALAAARAARDGHLTITVPGETQRFVRRLGLDGGVPRPAEGVLPVLATWSSTEPNHVGALVTTRVRYDVAIRSDGSARVQAEVSLENGAGTEPPSILLGRIEGGVPVGTLAAEVSLYLPAEARQVEAETSVPSPIARTDEFGYSAVTGTVEVRGGTSSTLTVSFLLDEAVVVDDDGGRLALRLLPQPTLDGVAYAVRLRLPDGVSFTSVSRELRGIGSTAGFTGTLTSPIDLETRFVAG